MAIAVIERATLVVPKTDQEHILRLLQAFQKIELIDSSSENEDILKLPNHALEQWKDSLARIEKAQTFLSGYIRTNALQKLKNGRPVMTMSMLEETAATGGWETTCSDVLSLNDRLDFLRSRRTELIQLTDQWTPWQELTFCPDSTSKNFTYTSLYVGTLKTAVQTAFSDAYAVVTSGLGHFENLFQRGEIVGAALLFPKEMYSRVKEFCKQYEFYPYDFPFDGLPAEMLENWHLEEGSILKEEAEILEKLQLLSAKKESLDLAEEFFRNLMLRDDAEKLMVKTKSTVTLSGWIDKEHSEELKELLKQEMESPYYLLFTEVEQRETSEVPVILKNKGIIRAFESLTEMYSMPSYDEIDPTPFMTPFYLVFFGMMVADIGYGVVLLLATFAAKMFFKPDKPLRKSVDFFFYLSFPVIVWGVIYGSSFGVSMPFALLSPTADIIPILIVSLVFGWMQLMTGLAMNVYVKLKKKDVLGAFSAGISWMALLLGLAVLVISKTVLIHNGMFFVGIILSIMAVLGIVLFPVAESRGHRVKGLMKGLYALYGATGYVGDLVSYTRLMALGVAGGSIAVAFNTIISSLPLPARLTLGIFLAIVLHVLNLFLSMLGAYVHGIRLQYVEFFGKFFGSGGRKFSPFKTVEKHIYLAENKNMQIQKTEESL